MYWPTGAARIYSANSTRRKDDYHYDFQGGRASQPDDSDAILGLRTSRSGHLIATITATRMTIWQASPIVVLATSSRSVSSIRDYGPNVAVLLRPDASIAVIKTSNGFLVTYSLIVDPSNRVYQQIHEGGNQQKPTGANRLILEQERAGLRELNIKFRMVIRIDAGIAAALTLDHEIIVATRKPAAVQCIKWTPDSAGRQTSTELISRMAWMHKGSMIRAMVYDRAMSLAVWITTDGWAYAVQRRPETSKDPDENQRLFRGYGFHTPMNSSLEATHAAINARFSMLAIGCIGGEIHIYTARDYAGSIPLSHKIPSPASSSTTGQITCLAYSPDGYGLVAAYEHGWALWSVYGKPGASSFNADTNISRTNDECWLMSVSNVSWVNAGSELFLTSANDSRIWVVEMAKSAVTTCFSSANISRTLLLTSSHLIIYRGFDLPSTATISADASLWQHVPVPVIYLTNQRPIRSAVTSHDGRYVAVAGKRGLAHYSVGSGRWKTFDDPEAENAFVVRGGMCWYQHVLIAAVESDDSYELRLYSRELGLNPESLLHVQQLPSAAVVMSMTGQDSLLVYTYENVLYHYIVNASDTTVTLFQVGQLALNGIVRAPARVRAVTWILPDFQLRDGDPSQDVAHASVLFLVDAKLVLLQSSTSEGTQKYDMRVIANNVEYFDLMRDQGTLINSPSQSLPGSPSGEQSPITGLHADRALRDSLWYFDGESVRCWTDVEDLLKSASTENDRDLPSPVSIATDFYPTSVILNRGIVLGLDSELHQRRDVHFAMFRHTIRTQLFLPHILRKCLSDLDPAAASVLALRYQDLPYFSHALELLLHMVLDDEVDANLNAEESLMPSVVSFLSSFPEYLDIVVQCTRKTEVRSWRTLFAYLPSPQQLFEESLEKNLLKTAGGYLLVLHTFQELETSSEQCIRLLQKAKEAGDWDLCKELGRFLMALDASGDTLREALGRMSISQEGENNGVPSDGNVLLATPRPTKSHKHHRSNGDSPESPR
ncbi:MAG: hypothetical protein L6R38_008439 [Xanthoria sp. 2 TBL-2021]|nr:MAG: hypothetical protein L6R38_008439 [Xanthoria sp. 2 TBL-2021]